MYKFANAAYVLYRLAWVSKSVIVNAMLYSMAFPRAIVANFRDKSFAFSKNVRDESEVITELLNDANLT